jgi:monoamine oxidase
MDRREFLRLAAIVAAPAAISIQPATEPIDSARTVIVGGGLAGLRAAGILKKAGRPVVVLEARAQPGGRVLTLREPFDEGLYAEAGAIRISAAHRTIFGLAREHGLTLVPFESPIGASLLTIGGVRSHSDETLDRAGFALDLRADERRLTPRALLEHYVGELPAGMADPTATARSYLSWRNYDRQTWPHWLLSRGASPDAVKLMTAGGDSTELSALYVLRQFALLNKSSHFFKIKGGMDLLPKALASELGDAVRYKAEVVRLTREPRRIRVEYLESGRLQSITARDVVIAVPFSTLRRVEIRPPFSPRKTRAIAELPYFPATRVLLQTRNRFWSASGLSGSARTDRPAEMWDCTYDLAATRGILGATAGGEAGRLTADMSSEQCLTFGKDLVAQAFPALPLNFEKGLTYRWHLEPWSRGAFAVFRPGQMTTFMPEVAQSEDRVHFAGEHTSSWMGWMEGALESGERAAREVLGSPGPA